MSVGAQGSTILPGIELGQVASGLEAGMRELYPESVDPLRGSFCDIASAAVQCWLNDRGVETELLQKKTGSQRVLPPPRASYHVTVLAEYGTDTVTLDSTYRQFIKPVFAQVCQSPDTEIDLLEASIAAFTTDEYRQASQQTARAVQDRAALVGCDQATKQALGQGLTAAYAWLWSPEGLKPFRPNRRVRYQGARIAEHIV